MDIKINVQVHESAITYFGKVRLITLCRIGTYYLTHYLPVQTVYSLVTNFDLEK